MILIDTNILSTFGKIEKLNLLSSVFGNKLAVSSNVFDELRSAKDCGYDFADTIFEMIKNGELHVLSPDEKELMITFDIPDSFGSGERDSVAICRNRGYAFLSNEKKVKNFCEKKGVVCIDLNGILKALWKFKILSKDDVLELINEIEHKDNVIVTSKDGILEE
jgi:predicted nucleic acid-binding protein